MPTFTLDIYKGWDADRLKTRCFELGRAVDHYQHMCMAMAEAPGALDQLHAEDRAKIERLIEAYKD